MILKQGIFEGKKAFEERVNHEANQGWKARSIAADAGRMAILMERSER